MEGQVSLVHFPVLWWPVDEFLMTVQVSNGGKVHLGYCYYVYIWHGPLELLGILLLGNC